MAIGERMKLMMARLEFGGYGYLVYIRIVVIMRNESILQRESIYFVTANA